MSRVVGWLGVIMGRMGFNVNKGGWWWWFVFYVYALHN